MIIYFILIISIVSLIILLIYYFHFFLKLSLNKSDGSDFNKPISVIICAKNEHENLKINLPLVLSQKYLEFEVIVVDDQSTDNTSFLLSELEKLYSNLVVVKIEKNVKQKIGKKFPLTIGIKTAKHDYLLLTDADCQPQSHYWIKKMVGNYVKNDIVLGYGAYKLEKGLLNKFIRFDTFNVAQQYLSYSLAGLTYMGVGRNLGYKKSIFFSNKGFASHIHIPSGDDDLFIQEVATNKNVGIEINQDTHTISDTVNSWGEWVYQKRRHVSTAPLYKTKYKLLLSLYSLVQFFFWTSFFILLLSKQFVYIVLTLIFIKILATYLINFKIMKRLNVLDLYWIHPIYEIIHVLIQGKFVILNLFNKPENWKA